MEGVCALLLADCASAPPERLHHRTGLLVCKAAGVTADAREDDEPDVERYRMILPPACVADFRLGADRASGGECGPMLASHGACLYVRHHVTVVVEGEAGGTAYAVRYW